jgi:putative hydrolase of the HAD superfamily
MERRIRAIIFDMDNTLFDFVAAKQHACREVAKFLGRDDWEALFSCFLESPHGFESHENIKEYFDLCGLLETATRCFSKIESPVDLLKPLTWFSKAEPPFGILDACSTRRIPDGLDEGRIHLPEGPSPAKDVPTGRSIPGVPGEGKIQPPEGSSISRKEGSTRKVVRDNLLADKSLYCNEVFSRCCAIYEAEKVRVLSPYPGVRETLGELRRRGIPLAIVTDAINGNALARLRKVGLAEYFDHVISFDMTGAKKPAPDAFLLALKKLGTLPSETLLVGDSLRRDIAPARQLGIITAYAKYGDRNVRGRDPPDCRPDHVLGDIRELVGLIE